MINNGSGVTCSDVIVRTRRSAVCGACLELYNVAIEQVRNRLVLTATTSRDVQRGKAVVVLHTGVAIRNRQAKADHVLMNECTCLVKGWFA